jgi:hypothetical protein
MPLRAFLPHSNNINTPFEEVIESLFWIFLVGLPITPDKGLRLAKNSSIGFKSGEYKGKIH